MEMMNGVKNQVHESFCTCMTVDSCRSQDGYHSSGTKDGANV